LERFPTLEALSEADESEFLSLWSGVGYYSRAKNMLKCAKEVASRYGGRFPNDLKLLQGLPGIGRYTAGALRNVCFEELTPAIDGNVGRVLARLGNIHLPIHSNEYISSAGALYRQIGQRAKPSEFFQALMELGEQICLPQPRCPECPVQTFCLAKRKNTAERLPVRRTKRNVEHFHWYLLLLQKDAAFYFVQNPERAFLKDAWIFPDLFTAETLSEKQIKERFRKMWGIRFRNGKHQKLSHSVTFRRISVTILKAANYEIRLSRGKWMTRHELQDHPTSSITSKVFSLAPSSYKSSNQVF
jgi:A/G-specific adenine glycosylase